MSGRAPPSRRRRSARDQAWCGWRALLAVVFILDAARAGSAKAAPRARTGASSPSPQPTYFTAGDTSDAYVLIVRNDGAAVDHARQRVTVTDTLPSRGDGDERLSPRRSGQRQRAAQIRNEVRRRTTDATVTCTYEEDLAHGAVLAGATIVVTITVSVSAEGHGRWARTSATVSGGGAPSASTSERRQRRCRDLSPSGSRSSSSASPRKAAKPTRRPARIRTSSPTSLAFNVSAREAAADPKLAARELRAARTSKSRCRQG